MTPLHVPCDVFQPTFIMQTKSSVEHYSLIRSHHLQPEVDDALMRASRVLIQVSN